MLCSCTPVSLCRSRVIEVTVDHTGGGDRVEMVGGGTFGRVLQRVINVLEERRLALSNRPR